MALLGFAQREAGVGGFGGTELGLALKGAVAGAVDEGQRLVSRCAIARRRQASMNIAQVAWRGDEQLATGEIRIGCVDAQSFRPRRIPEPMLNALAEQAQRLALSPTTSKNTETAE